MDSELNTKITIPKSLKNIMDIEKHPGQSYAGHITELMDTKKILEDKIKSQENYIKELELTISKYIRERDKKGRFIA